MRVTHFSPDPIDALESGLSNINFRRLGRIVVLAGPNGAGKTRILKSLTDSLACLKGVYSSDTASLTSVINSYEQVLARPEHPEASRGVYEGMIRNTTRALNLRQTCKLEPPNSHGRIQTAYFPTAAVDFGDPMLQLPATLVAVHDSATQSIGTSELRSKAPLYIHHIASLYYNATHCETAATKDDRDRIAERWESLKNIVSTLLYGAAVTRDVQGKVLIDGSPCSRLSDGQKALLIAATTIHAQSANLEEAILLVDEPELHLHPSALLEYIDRLIEVTPNGQVWIATHSIHILSRVDPSSLWFVEAGTAKWAGKRPEAVLSALVGDETRIGQLERFLHLPAVYAMERFASECLLSAEIVDTGPEDSQSRQIRDILGKIESTPLRVLDFGAGKGRILATLREQDTFAQRIDYHAYELDDTARSACVDAVTDAYSTDAESPIKRVYANEDDIREKLNRASVDVVVMCNVLHEIEPNQWTKIFTGVLSDLLRPKGYLLIVEDMQIPRGEHAHTHGFILLDTEHLQDLFAVDREDEDCFRSFCQDSRLKAHLVRGDMLKNVSSDTVKTALYRRQDSAKAKIRALREEPSSFPNGRLLGLYTMLHSNASLALDDF